MLLCPPCAAYLAVLTTRVNIFHAMLSPLNGVEIHEIFVYIISFTLLTTNGFSFIASFTTLFPNVGDMLSAVTVDPGWKPDQKYARRRDRQKYVGRIK